MDDDDDMMTMVMMVVVVLVVVVVVVVTPITSKSVFLVVLLLMLLLFAVAGRKTDDHCRTRSRLRFSSRRHSVLKRTVPSRKTAKRRHRHFGNNAPRRIRMSKSSTPKPLLPRKPRPEPASPLRRGNQSKTGRHRHKKRKKGKMKGGNGTTGANISNEIFCTVATPGNNRLHYEPESVLGTEDIFCTELDRQNLCTRFNKKLKASSGFRGKKCTRIVELATTRDSLDSLEVYLTKSVKERKFELCIPSGKYIVQTEDVSFDQSHLNCWKRQESKITWRIILLPLQPPNFLFESTNISQFRQINSGGIIQNVNTIEAKVFSVVKDDEGGKDAKRKMVSYVADIEDGVKTDTRKECNEFVGANSLPDRTPVSIPDSLPKSSSNTIIPEFLKTPVICLDATRMFDNGETINAWLGKSILKRNSTSPDDVYLIEVAPFVKVCLLHNKSPAMCFSDMQLHLTSKTFYHSEKEYVDFWCKALLAEASHDAVNTKQIVLISDVQLVWSQLEQRPENCSEYKPKKNLFFKISQENLSFMEFVMKVKIGPGDLVCARYSIPLKNKEFSKEQHAVYHFVVQNIKEGDTKTVYMRPMGEYGCRVSPVWREILRHAPPCELQIIRIPVSFNRLFCRLKCMETACADEEENTNGYSKWSSLAVNVALGNIFTQDFHDLHFNHSTIKSWGDKSKTLNTEQTQAIKLALQKSFSLIQGPPGTGKSFIGAHLAYTFAMGNKRSGKKGCVLYCGPSNKAVDVVHDYFLTSNNQARSINSLRILRLYGRMHEKLDIKDPICGLKLDVEDKDGKCQERFKCDALHCKVRQLENGKVAAMESSFAELMKEKIIPSIKEWNYLKEITNKFEKEILSDPDPYDIILCTCNETCSRRVLSHLKIAQCIVDECGMAYEPETLAAISLAEHAVLIGDHMQLQPVVKYQPARQCGLATSLFERYAEMESDCKIFTQLTVQYRMHPKICDIPSKLFYGSTLRTGKSVQKRKPLAESLSSFWPQGHDYPIMFCDVVGKEIDSRTSPTFKGDVDPHSKSNEEEAHKTIELIKLLVEKHCLKTSDIAVLTPYAAQRQLIKELLDKSHIKNVVAASIIESQGDEYNIVILNTVRSLPLNIINHRFQPDSRWIRNNLGFVADPHQMNVGITRAKHGLIIIGNQALLECSSNWRKLIEIYDKCKCIVHIR